MYYYYFVPFLIHQVSPQTRRRARASLSDISSLRDIEGLSVRQLKEILARNFVNFSGCCEKWELVERVSRLYRETEENRKSCGYFILMYMNIMMSALFSICMKLELRSYHINYYSVFNSDVFLAVENVSSTVTTGKLAPMCSHCPRCCYYTPHPVFNASNSILFLHLYI